ncbi:MAG: LuxR C-terminal-related transcriptional regulator, partial [Deltaproteobacteria bacterium]|nr:LuxR C-terminal-related transcriptional regulator [Deltaproteobacteria bacterium]
VLDVIQFTLSCKDEPGIKALLFKVRELVGGDYSICGIGKGGMDGLCGPPQIINGNYPDEWLRIYGGNELYYADPLVLRNFSNPGSQLWDETYSLYRDKMSPLFLSSRDHGLMHGVTGGMYSDSNKTASLFSFSGKGRWFSKREMDILSTVGPHIHQALLRIFKAQQSPCGSLSRREKEIVQWIKEGKTNWEISIILKISERTVKFHVQNIERKLNAVNKTHVVAILMEQGAVD